MQTIFRTPRKIIIGMPMIIRQRGAARIIYNSIDNWKFNEALPFWFTQSDSSFLDNQQISGPMIPPKGKKKPANPERWHNIAQLRSDSDNSLISLMTIVCL
jgi:hypothetical protein